MMPKEKLSKAPLQEVIFEIFWHSHDVAYNKTPFPSDEDFEISQGIFQSLISDRYPIRKRLLPLDAPFQFEGKPLHQFWKGDTIWPVIQLGPGLLTVNDTNRNYNWEENFKPDVYHALEVLERSYGRQMIFDKVSLKYIDSVEISFETNIVQYIKENLQTSIVNKFSVPGKQSAFNITQIFDIDDSKISLNIQTAQNNANKTPAIVWITTVQKTGNFSADDVRIWLDNAHNLTSDFFVEMLNPDFYASFK